MQHRDAAVPKSAGQEPAGATFRSRLDSVPLSVLGTTVERLRALPAERRYPLHQGQSWFAAPVRLDGEAEGALGLKLQHDGPPQGIAALLESIAATLEQQLGRSIPLESVQVTNGITHGLSLAFGSLLAPGDSVLMLSPQWLFAAGIAASWGARAVEVPYFHSGRPTSADEITALLDRHFEPARTRAIYFNSPNNPTGLALARWEIEAIGSYARARGVALVADNAYEAFDFASAEFPDAAAEGLFPDITIGLYSFSKTYGWTGFRIGYMIMPEPIARTVRVLALHSIYCVSTAAQFAALQGLQRRSAIVDRHRSLVARNLDRLRAECRIPRTEPAGGFYTLLDVADYPGGAPAFLDDAIARGVSLAPGSAFGATCRDSVRLCFAVVEEDRLGEALRLLNAVYEERH
jgi:aspartate/methionine/tyrosine aminotransferase